MRLEARSPNCFSSVYVLKRDGRPIGEFRSRWFSESIDVRLTGRRGLTLAKIGWLGSQFQLIDAGEETVVGTARRAGLFTSAWELDLGSGPAELVSAGWFNTAYLVSRDGLELARVNRAGVCEGGWYVQGALDEAEMILVGLVYQTILSRRRRSHHHHHH